MRPQGGMSEYSGRGPAVLVRPTPSEQRMEEIPQSPKRIRVRTHVSGLYAGIFLRIDATFTESSWKVDSDAIGSALSPIIHFFGFTWPNRQIALCTGFTCAPARPARVNPIPRPIPTGPRTRIDAAMLIAPIVKSVAMAAFSS